MGNCKHLEFESHVSVGRLLENEGDKKVKRFVADIKIRCKKCKLEFQFIGLSGGVNPNYPTTNFDATELRCPIRPNTKPEPNNNIN